MWPLSRAWTNRFQGSHEPHDEKGTDYDVTLSIDASLQLHRYTYNIFFSHSLPVICASGQNTLCQCWRKLIVSSSPSVVASPTIVLFHGVSARNCPSTLSFFLPRSVITWQGSRDARGSHEHFARDLFVRSNQLSICFQPTKTCSCVSYDLFGCNKIGRTAYTLKRPAAKYLTDQTVNIQMEILFFWKYYEEEQRHDFPRNSIIDKRGLTRVTRAGRIKVAWALRWRRSILIKHWQCRPAKFHWTTGGGVKIDRRPSIDHRRHRRVSAIKTRLLTWVIPRDTSECAAARTYVGRNADAPCTCNATARLPFAAARLPLLNEPNWKKGRETTRHSWK